MKKKKIIPIYVWYDLTQHWIDKGSYLILKGLFKITFCLILGKKVKKKYGPYLT